MEVPRIFLVAVMLSLARGNRVDNKTSVPIRDDKAFSVFNIVTFKNVDCRSQSTLSSGSTGSTARNGTCYTSQECDDKGGTASGTCAAGFGVCCLFIVTSGTFSQNCTYLRNSGFPNAYSDTSDVTYTVNKCTPGVCSLRLDFEQFTIVGLANTLEVVTTNVAPTVGGQCVTDSFTVTGNGGVTYPTICGQNTGQHIYVDMGQHTSGTAQVRFTFTGSSSNRIWEIKATQIPCGSNNAPQDCFQYHTGLTGRFTTFNFIPTDETHLANHNYAICIRQEEGYCCVQYQICSDGRSFSIGSLPSGEPGVDFVCTSTDYITIEGSGGVCSQAGNNAQYYSTYCGSRLGFDIGATINADVPVCDCTSPFIVGIYTNLFTDEGVSSTNMNTQHSRGVCLEYKQFPC